MTNQPTGHTDAPTTHICHLLNNLVQSLLPEDYFITHCQHSTFIHTKEHWWIKGQLFLDNNKVKFWRPRSSPKENEYTTINLTDPKAIEKLKQEIQTAINFPQPDYHDAKRTTPHGHTNQIPTQRTTNQTKP